MPVLASVEWSSDQKEAFSRWLRRELYQTQGDREELENTWENALLQWRAKMTDADLDYPYPGASNLELPLTDMHVTPVVADMLQSFHAAEDYWMATAKRPDRVDVASALREGMTAIEKRYLKMRRVNQGAFLENTILGTAFYKNRWRSERKGRRRYERDGSSTRLIENVSAPAIERVPIQRMWFPAYAWSLDFDAPGGTPWIAQEFRWSLGEFDRFAKGSEFLPGFDRDAAKMVRNFETEDSEPIRDEMEREDEFTPFENLEIKIYEVWARFDVRGNGVYEDIQVLFHMESGAILRAIYFPNAHGKHDFHAINYLPGYGIYGIGMAEVDEWAQEASTQLLNAQIDNARLANTRMFTAPMGSMHQPDELIYPGKVWYLNPDESIGEVRLSELYPSGFTLLQQLVSFSELRSGVNELRQGNISGLPSRTPATSLLSILQEGNKRFDMVHANARDVHSEMGLRMLQNVAQHAKMDPLKWQQFFSNVLGPEDAAKVMEVLGTPDVEAIEEAFGISVSATSGRTNKEVEKQSFIGMMQVAGQIYGSLVQTALLMSQVPDETVRATAAASYASGVDILGQLFDRFDVQNKAEHMGGLEEISAMLLQQTSPQGQGGGMNPQMLQGLGVLGGSNGLPPQGLDPAALSQILGI